MVVVMRMRFKMHTHIHTHDTHIYKIIVGSLKLRILTEKLVIVNLKKKLCVYVCVFVCVCVIVCVSVCMCVCYIQMVYVYLCIEATGGTLLYQFPLSSLEPGSLTE